MKIVKILHIASHLNVGGVTSYLYLLSELLVKSGHSVTVLSAGGEREEDFRRAGIQSAPLLPRTKNEFHPKILWALSGLARWVKAEGFDCIHAHSRVGQVAAYFLSRMTGVPVVTTAHGFFKPRLGRRILPAWGSRVIAISPLVAQDLETSHEVDPRNIRKIHNAVDVAALEKKLAAKSSAAARKELGIPESAVVLASVSRLVEDKGHAYLIDAAAELSRMYSQIFIFIVGDGREREALEKRIEAAGLKSRARIVTSMRDTAAVYAACDIFVHPATHREGFGLAMAEAMVAAKPVVVTDIPATNALVFEGENGFVVPPKDAAALAKKIHFILENPVAAREVAERGRAWAKDIARPERFLKETEDVYREVAR